MKFCPECGGALNGATKKCSACGKSLKRKGRAWLWFLLGFLAAPALGAAALVIRDEMTMLSWSKQVAEQEANLPIEYWNLPDRLQDQPSPDAYDIRRFDLPSAYSPPEYASEPSDGGKGVPGSGGPGLNGPGNR
jgi:hypothetical protein